MCTILLTFSYLYNWSISTMEVALFPGHFQILSCNHGKTDFLHSCEIKSGSGYCTWQYAWLSTACSASGLQKSLSVPLLPVGGQTVRNLWQSDHSWNDLMMIEMWLVNDHYLHSSQSSVFVQYVHLTCYSHPDVETECQITVCIQSRRVQV